MQRKRSIGTALGVGGLALVLTAFALVLTGSAFAHPSAERASKLTIVSVTAGKPSELAFALSKTSNLKPGLITFKVKNVGRAIHDFKICTTPVKKATANTCTGKVTKMLSTGQSAVLVVKLSKTGMYEYLCSVTGHAAAGMKGLIGIGVKASSTPVPVAVTTTPAAAPATTSAAAAPPAANPPAAGGANADGCPPGTTIQSQDSSLGGDHDEDDDGGMDDLDGCI